MHHQFLAGLRERPDDRAAWLVYADWLDERGDPTGRFLRLSLEITAGQFAVEDAEARIVELEQLYATAHPDSRDLLATYRSGLPTRFRILERFHVGGGSDMFASRTFTFANGFLEAGQARPGMNLGVGTEPDGRPRVLHSIEVFARILEMAAAGREPLRVALAWWGHLPIEAGRVLTVAPATGTT